MPPRPTSSRSKSVTFCVHCEARRTSRRSDPDLRYYSDPGRDRTDPKPKRHEPITDSTDSDLKYYSEPDANNYFEIDYVFLKELRRIARSNCPKCRRKRSRKNDRDKCGKDKKSMGEPRESRVSCNGRYHSVKEHCRSCCRACNRSADTSDLATEPARVPRSRSTPKTYRDRRNSIQSNKAVSFLGSSNDESITDETNYTAKSFTNDLKKFLLKPSAPRFSLRDKFITSFRQELEAATKRSPKLKAIKGLWKSY